MYSDPLLSSAESLRDVRRMKINPISSLTAQYLVSALDQFEFGYLRQAALLFDVIAQRDDTIASVKPKREKEVSQLDWQIQPTGDETGRGYEEQRAVLEKFWNSVRAVNAYDRNERGGFKRLVRQMMLSVSMRYSVHHIIWTPTANGLQATFEHVPLWLFENITGTLRYLRNPHGTEGETLADGEWMVTYGDGLMIPCSIGYFAKRNSYNDWLIFSERFSMPGVLGRTSAAKGSPEGEAMRSAVMSFGHDYQAVLYGDDGSQKDPLQLIQADGNPQAMPMPAIIERVDRKFASLYRGADLSTMSSRDGEGTGASLQGDEKEILLTDDAEVITETLAQVSAQVLEWEFGNGVEILAKLVMIPPADEDTEKLLDAACKLADRGVKISKSDILERATLVQATTDDDAMLPGGGGGRDAVDEKPVNEAVPNSRLIPEVPGEDLGAAALAALYAARQADMKPLAERLEAAMAEEDEAALKSLLGGIRDELPEWTGQVSEGQADVLEMAYTAALLEEDPAVSVANSGTSEGAKKGWLTRLRSGWRPLPEPEDGIKPFGRNEKRRVFTGEEQARSIRAALRDQREGKAGEYSLGMIPDDLAARVEEATALAGAPAVVRGRELRIDDQFITHAKRYHPNLSDDDFLKIPEMMNQAAIISPGKTAEGLATVNFERLTSGREYRLVAVHVNKRGQLRMQTYKKSAEGGRLK